jgi:UPF0716 family protein affecting phage T7 exclusion
MVLLTPGLLTDLLGFLCLIPATRGMIRAQAWRALTRAVQQGRGDIHVSYGRPPYADPNVIDHDSER